MTKQPLEIVTCTLNELQIRTLVAKIEVLKEPISLHIDDRYSPHYQNGFGMAVDQFESYRALRIATLKKQLRELSQ